MSGVDCRWADSSCFIKRSCGVRRMPPFMHIELQLLDGFIVATRDRLVAATVGTPADVIKTRVMNQPTDPKTGPYA